MEKSLTELNLKVVELELKMGLMEKQTLYFENLLIRGIDGNPSLPEVVRALTSTVDTFIKSQEDKERRKQEQWDKWKWLILGVLVPTIILFIIQAGVFIIRLVPLAFP